jgi:ABC-type amino acid transport substrate-binding protein
MRFLKLASAVALASILSSTPTVAQESATLKKIKDTASITLGHRESSIPFSYYDDKQQVIGYSHELMLKVVEDIKINLKLAKLDVKLMPVTSANRITLIQNGTVDIECGSTTNNQDRQKQVSFSSTIFVIGTRLMTRMNSGIKDFADLSGKNVVTTAGTTSERLLRKMNEGRLRTIHQFDESHRRVVADTEATLQDAKVAARTGCVARPISANSLTTISRSRRRSNARRLLASVGVLPRVIIGSTTRRSSLAFGNGGLDGLVLEQGNGHVAQHRQAMAAGTVQFAKSIAVTHG